MVVKPKVVMAETPEQKDSMGTLHTDEDVAEVDAKAKAGTLKHNPRPEGVSTNPDMQADSAQKTVVNVPEATAQGGQAEQDWRAGLKNPNQHLENYGDDSSLPYQEHPETLGGTSAKYEGEGVKTTSGEEIDRGLTLDQLDPNYKYGQESQIYGSEHDGYIQSRNDRIAIALWNAGIRDPEGIRAWLEKQPGFMNSSEHDRNNTVMSIYKRMGTEPAKEGEAEWSPAKGEGMNLEDTEGGKIYGKDTPSETDPDRGIKTEVDPLNITNQMNATREANVKAMLSMKPTDIGAALAEGVSVCGGEQTLRDIKQFYPSFYAQIEDAIKQYNGQKDINSITTSGTVDATSEVDKSNDVVNNGINDWVSKNSDERTKDEVQANLTNKLSQNQTINSARGQLTEYKEKIAELEQKIANLPTDARKMFKGDVPQYLVNAVVANRTQQYQSEISKYQSLYAATLDEVKMEIAQDQWQQEFDLKKQQLEIDTNYKNAQLDLAKAELGYNIQKTSVTNGKWNDDGTYSYVDINGQMHTLSAEEAEEMLASTEENGLEYINYWKGKLEQAQSTGGKLMGGQCEYFTDNYARQYYGVSMKGANGETTTAEEKAAYATEALPKTGYIAVFNYTSGTDAMKKRGHTALVIDYDPKTGYFTTIESNHNGDSAVTLQRYSINNPNLKGFWNPAAEALRQQKQNANGDIHYYYNTPMYDVFQEAYASAGTKDERINIDQAREAYSILNELNKGGYIDIMVNNEVISSLMTDLAQLSMVDLKNRNFVDNDGNIAWDVLKQFVVNGTLDPDMGYAIDRLHRLVEIKLRKESGAAINISEWLGNFDMYMPQVNMDSDYKMKRLQSMEHDMVSGLLPTNLVGRYIPIIAKEQIKASNKDRNETIDRLADEAVDYYAEEEEEKEF